jgi:membrane protein DedA with SNARE-associated domain
MWTILAGLVIATFLSEDAALVGAAGLARTGVLAPVLAGAVVALGIWIGDIGLFLAGALARRWPPVARWVDRRCPRSELRVLASRLERRAAWALIISRAIPGTRVPLYITAGACRLRPQVFLVCTGIAVAVWTAAIVAGAQWLP